MYKVIGYSGTRAFRVMWMLDELGLPYRHENVMPFSDAARARTPQGRLPALELPDGQLLLDSTAILTFLADQEEALTHPAGTVERARQDEVLHRVLELIDAPLMAWTLGVQRRGDPIAPQVQDWLGGQVSGGMDRVGDALGDDPRGPWITGAVFTFADIVLGHCLHWAERYEQPVRHPRLRAHLAAAQMRSGYRNADAA